MSARVLVYTRAGCHLCEEADQKRSPLLDHTAFRDETRGLRHALCKDAPYGKISAFGSIGRAGPATQCKDLHA